MFSKATAMFVCLASLFLTSCSPTRMYPHCPMGNAQDYIKCATQSDESDEGVELVAAIVTHFCEEEPSEWLPVLDRNAKRSVADLRQFGYDKLRNLDKEEREFSLLKEEVESTSNEDMFAGSVALYLMGPTIAGFGGETGSCIEVFERIVIGELIERLREQEER